MCGKLSERARLMAGQHQDRRRYVCIDGARRMRFVHPIIRSLETGLRGRHHWIDRIIDNQKWACFPVTAPPVPAEYRSPPFVFAKCVFVF